MIFIMPEISANLGQSPTAEAEIPPLPTPEVPPSPKEKDGALKPEVNRLLFDTDYPEPPVVKFDSFTGEDYRERPNEGSLKKMIVAAVEQVRQALGYKAEARFSPYSGRPLPELKQVAATARDGSQVKTPDYPSYAQRLGVLRQDMKDRVDEAEKSGKKIPGFDSETGQPIPRDSLRAYRSAYPQEAPAQPTTPGKPVIEDLKEEMELGLQGLREMKRIRHEEELRKIALARAMVRL